MTERPNRGTPLESLSFTEPASIEVSASKTEVAD